MPELEEKIKTGEVSLNQIQWVQIAAREVQKTQKREVSATERAEVLELIRDHSPQKAQQVIAQQFEIPVKRLTIQHPQADGSVRVEMTLSPELKAKLSRAQELLSHALLGQDITDFLDYVCDRVIKQKTSVRPTSAMKATGEPGDAQRVKVMSGSGSDESGTKFRIAPPAQGCAFTARTRKMILNHNPRCTYRSPVTGKVCGAAHFLQADHLKPRWAGGGGDTANGQSLCATHNRQKYRHEAGLR